jgi:hypothetical protein
MVDRLNLDPILSNQVSWDQPHEGDLLEHLLSRRALTDRDVTSVFQDTLKPVLFLDSRI